MYLPHEWGNPGVCVPETVPLVVFYWDAACVSYVQWGLGLSACVVFPAGYAMAGLTACTAV